MKMKNKYDSIREATVRLGDGRKVPVSRRSRIPSCKLLTS